VPERTLKVLKDLASALRKAAGQPSSTGDAGRPASGEQQGSLDPAGVTGATRLASATEAAP
jgi:hypothetical protein